MYGGIPRTAAIASFQKSSEISHTTYFHSEVTRQRMLNALMQDSTKEPARGFQAMRSPNQTFQVDNETRGEKKKRVDRARLVFIPAQMATQLNYGAENIWPDGVARRGVEFLKQSLDVGDVDQELYGPLLRELSESFDVHPFGFDWRKSIKDAGERLVKLLQELLAADSTTPVHIVAHSGGGFAALWYRAHNRETRQQLGMLNSRIVLLGLPHSGSLHVTSWFIGEGPLVKGLVLLDPQTDANSIAETFAGFEGLVELLPKTKAQDFLEPETWRTIHKTAPSGLQEARTLRDKLVDACTDDSISIICGEGIGTPVSVEHAVKDANGERTSDWHSTESLAGDGFVTPSTTFKKCVHYVRSDHKGLASSSHASVIVELLGQATTDRLRKAPLATPSAFDESRITSLNDPVLFPSGPELVISALGGEHQPYEAAGSTLRIEVVHGSISQCKVPVMVGHYEATPLGGAEKYIDEQFDGVLSKRHAIGHYPEQPSESLFVPGKSRKPPGAIIIGMGKSGELSNRRLMQAVTSGVLDFALHRLGEQDDKENPECVIEFASVLLGSHGLGLPIEASISAVIDGTLEANSVLKSLGLGNIRIGSIQFTERYGDLATKAFEGVNRVLQSITAEHRDGVLLESSPILRQASGRHEGRPTEEYDRGSWSRLEIRSVKRDDDSRLVEELNKRDNAKTDDERAKVLSEWRFVADQMSKPRFEFTSFGRRARVEKYQENVQERNIMGMIQDAIESHELTQTNNTLFERLIPNEFKEEFRDGDNRVLILDERSAVIPWEMLAYRDRDGRLIPIAKKTGMLRQLIIDRPTEFINSPRGSHALVIGDPDCTPWPRLHSARREARRVADKLKEKGYQVNELISTEIDSPSWLDIENSLFEHEYRIVHIAAHGQYQKQNPEESGVVIGPGYFLAAQTIGKLRVVPDFVFLNCCHLGKTHDELAADTGSPKHPWNELAASISTELMRIGVKAVIAAGWEVVDADAQKFAITLYDSLFAGRNLGDAVLEARKATTGNSNTWGAYQCYGDPGFRLPKATNSSEPASSQRSLVERVSRISNTAKHDYGQANASTREKRRLQCLKELGELAKSPQTWLDGRAKHAFGQAYFDLGDFESALGWFYKAENDSGADASNELLQDLSNLEVRLATKLHRDKAAPQIEIDRLFEAAKGRLDKLELFRGKSSELLSLLGSLHKKRATVVSNSRQKKAEIKASCTCYREAFDLAVKEKKDLASKKKSDPRYPAINAIAMGKLAGVASKDEELMQVLDATLETVQPESTDDKDFWARAALPDAKLAKAILTGKLSSNREEIQELYESAFRADSTSRQRGSVLEHLSDLILLVDQKNLLSALRELRQELSDKHPI